MFTCGPDKVMVVSGVGLKEPKYVVGGRVFVFPKIQRIQFLTLNTINLEIHTSHVYTRRGVPINVTGVANVKIDSNNDEMLKAAATIFLSKNERQIHDIALSTVEGHQRAVIGELTVEEIYLDRNKVSNKIFEVSAADLASMGLSIVSYTFKAMSDDRGYLDTLGRTRIEQVKCDGRIGEAEAHMQSQIQVAHGLQMARLAEYENNLAVARSKRDYEMQQAGFDAEVQTNKARADLAYRLQAAKTQQAIRLEEKEVEVVERAQAAQIMQQEAARRERELEATVMRPAEAEKYRIVKAAEGERQRLILEAQAHAEAEKLRGEAEAFAVAARGSAEAEQMYKKAGAYQQYTEAARVQMLVDALPKVNAAIGDNLKRSDARISMIAGGDNVGANQVAAEVMQITERMPLLVADMSGVDVTQKWNGNKK